MPSLAERIEQTRVDDRLAAPHDLWQVREDQVRAAGQFGSVYQDELTQQRRSYLSLIPDTLRASAQLELDLPAYSERAEIRRRLATKIAGEVLPGYCPRWLERYPEKLRSARQTGCFGLRRDTGRPIVFWDEKAGLSRLCPDDAREEAQRLKRRVLEPLQAAQADGASLDYVVFTTPNAKPGELRHGMQAIYRRFKKVMPKFPQIKGALCVLEAPLGQARDWNVHLNVILVSRGFMDWKALRAAWHWNLEIRRLPKAPGAIAGALSELIKYAVASTASKSEEHAGRSPAPAMLEWSGAELTEWLCAMHAFRRTRTYGVLYRLPDPEPDVGPVVWIGQVRMQHGRYVHSVPLLDSIPEDKSLHLSPLERFKKLCRQMKPPPNLTLSGRFPTKAEIDMSLEAHYAKKAQESVQN
jgi:hypothetical protein